MKLYGGRKINRSIDRRFRTHTESRDAIVWDVDQINGIARCKVQGSNELIQCHYPQNWESLPYYVKPGFAIRVIHKGGQKGYQEIVGPGRAIPSPVFGAIMPPLNPLFDTIEFGMTPTAPGGGMYVNLTNGQFRIDGISYVFDIGDGGVLMGGDENIMDPITGLPMGAGTNATLVFDPAPTIPNARYDLVVVAADGIADIIKGVASANPVMPNIPADHIKIFHVLILGGKTELVQENIGVMWNERLLSSISIGLSGTYNSSGTGMYCSLTNAHPILTVVATLLCQYGWPFISTYSLTMTQISGSGTIGPASNGPWGITPILKSGTGSTINFYYRRDEVLFDPAPPGGPLEIDSTAEQPLIVFTIADSQYIQTTGGIYFDLLFIPPP